MKQIKLTQNKYTLVDDEDFEWLNQKKWHVSSSNYALRNSDGKKIFMHREIMNTPQGMETDHINGDKLDNRKENLRVCTSAENNRNVWLTKSNKTGFKGIHKHRKGWEVRISVRNRNIYLGVYKDKIKAAEAYNEGAKKYHGAFAKLNPL